MENGKLTRNDIGLLPISELRRRKPVTFIYNDRLFKDYYLSPS